MMESLTNKVYHSALEIIQEVSSMKKIVFLICCQQSQNLSDIYFASSFNFYLYLTHFNKKHFPTKMRLCQIFYKKESKHIR